MGKGHHLSLWPTCINSTYVEKVDINNNSEVGFFKPGYNTKAATEKNGAVHVAIKTEDKDKE